MTVVGAIPDGKGGYYIGADGLSTSNGNICSIRERKIFSAKRWALGISGHMRMGELLWDDWDQADAPGSFVESVQNALKSDGWSFGEADGEPKWAKLNLLLVGLGGLWKVCSDFSMILHDPDFAPGLFVGSGSDIAMGAAIYGAAADHEPEAILRRSLEAACRIDLHCGGELTIHHVPGPDHG